MARNLLTKKRAVALATVVAVLTVTGVAYGFTRAGDDVAAGPGGDVVDERRDDHEHHRAPDQHHDDDRCARDHHDDGARRHPRAGRVR